MTAQVASQYLRVTGCYGFQHGIMNEDVLVLRLNHVVALGAQARHVTIDIDGVDVLETLQHRVDHDECACPTHASTAEQ